MEYLPSMYKDPGIEPSDGVLTQHVQSPGLHPPNTGKRQKQEKLKLKEGPQEERGEEGREMGRRVKFFSSMEMARVLLSTASIRAAFSVLSVCLSCPWLFSY